MMSTRLKKVAEVIATEMLALAQIIVAETDGGSLSGSHLRETIRTQVQTESDSVVISLLFDNYIEYIENGRAPRQGKRPPIDALREWAIGKGIEPDNDTLFAIAEAIWRDGIEPRPIMATLEERIGKQFETRWAEMLFEALTDDLIKYFNS
ncbi:hypothetical protein [Dysgonomonas sp. 25]|uniref:hypothetical protein n=1 Tax=Dysgonomonas sp. 25 TaxID=2302933 RepID=UPI0013D0F0F0|nr:hypothetical protein [Dysgonomonas sp. 25]NDV69255.1 hypothetical protein [Dysgonomonas sp. 25]